MSKPYNLEEAASFFDKVEWWIRIANILDRKAYAVFAGHAGLITADNVFELGPGTGSLARAVLQKSSSIKKWILAEASEVLAKKLSTRFDGQDPRAVTYRVTRPPPLPFPDQTFDRFVACFVLDCMDRETQVVYLAEAHRLLVPGGCVCAMSVTAGDSFVSAAIMGLGNLLSRISPVLALGARFVDPSLSFDSAIWRTNVNMTVRSAGFTTRIIVAAKL